MIELQTPPPELLPKSLREEASKFERLKAEHLALWGEAGRLQQAAGRAANIDRPKLVAEYHEANQRQLALGAVVAEAQGKLTASIEAARAELADTVAAKVAEARASYAESIEDVDVASRALAVAEATAAWLERFPRKPVIQVAPRQVGTSRWSEVVADLRASVTPPRRDFQPIEPPPELDDNAIQVGEARARFQRHQAPAAPSETEPQPATGFALAVDS